MIKRLSFPFLGFVFLAFSIATSQPADAAIGCNGKDCKWFESSHPWLPGHYLCISVPPGDPPRDCEVKESHMKCDDESC